MAGRKTVSIQGRCCLLNAVALNERPFANEFFFKKFIDQYPGQPSEDQLNSLGNPLPAIKVDQKCNQAIPEYPIAQTTYAMEKQPNKNAPTAVV